MRMKKVFVFLLFSGLFFSCKKTSSTQQTTGYLRYISPAVDGPGLYFITDAEQETLYFHNDYGDEDLQYQAYKDSLGLHLRLTFIDEGESGCHYCQVPGVKNRIVKEVGLIRE